MILFDFQSIRLILIYPLSGWSLGGRLISLVICGKMGEEGKLVIFANRFFSTEMDYSFYTKQEAALLSECTICPRECRADRLSGRTGYCRTGGGMNIASVCIHRGEEPPISGPDGICNIFFSGCNLRCVYCQNHEISRQTVAGMQDTYSYTDAIDTIISILEKGIRQWALFLPRMSFHRLRQ